MAPRISIFVGILTIIGRCVCECPDGWLYFQSSCYQFISHGDFDFQDAQKYCEHFGASLVNIQTSAENNFIKSYAGDFKAKNYWIGLTDEVIEGSWNWYPSETAATFTDFSASRGHQGKGSNCVVLWSAYHYQWLDANCASHYHPICEMP